ncbi:AraC family transcriptional regulator [Citricoccus sp. SGAir0253]|uniref:helix-turn-helix transcriptional regulator n=1 Tax=Citricoccus sp. SGAir0253 TaxID=2567881 RepID=UPI0010CD5182|nr:helix-turn-helix transcriptional regulator [Citricoccus sp. SGAir0253]QCU79115.1 AraC family transcriptional regulator [Citricoccus sp. SGAir0253]
MRDQQAEHEAAARRAARFITERAAEPITVADMADVAGYSPFHFTRMFAARVHVTPNRFLAGVRFHRAKRLLLAGDDAVVDVCQEVGFTSPGTFTRRFREDVGVSPSGLRRLADRLSVTTPAPFALYPQGITEADLAAGRPRPAVGMLGTVEGTVRLPPALRPGPGPEPLVWIGCYPTPFPVGLPVTGLLREGEGGFRLPVLDRAPWLLATAVPATAEPAEHLAGPRPAVGRHPVPLTGPATVRLELGDPEPWGFPLLTALPSLMPDRTHPTRRTP